MKAVICKKYGAPELLQIVDIDKPEPKANEVLIKIRATTVHIGDTKIRRFEPGLGPVKDFFFKPLMRLMMGFNGPRNPVLGMEFAGDVESIGNQVTRFKIGDPVFASTEFRMSAHAEYCCMPEKSAMSIKPANMSYEEAAPVSNAGLTALINLRKGNIQKGHEVLIYGASGSVGTYAIQIAKDLGAVVTAVCSTSNLELVQSIGADKVIDYSKIDFTEMGKQYDIIFDAVGKIPYPKRRVALKKSGKYLTAMAISGNVKLKAEDLDILKEMCESGKLTTVIDRQYALKDIIEAHRYVDKGHKKGNVVITVP